MSESRQNGWRVSHNFFFGATNSYMRCDSSLYFFVIFIFYSFHIESNLKLRWSQVLVWLSLIFCIIEARFGVPCRQPIMRNVYPMSLAGPYATNKSPSSLSIVATSFTCYLSFLHISLFSLMADLFSYLLPRPLLLTHDRLRILELILTIDIVLREIGTYRLNGIEEIHHIRSGLGGSST